MLVPVLSKIQDSSEVLIERVLPVSGQLLVTEGTHVAPYDHLGLCTFSQKILRLSHKFKPTDLKRDGQFYYYNSRLGYDGKTKIDAPYNGNLHKTKSGGYEFTEETKKYTLLSGVWGDVTKIIDANSVLIKASMRDLNLVVATKTMFAGELLVFPNPTHFLEKFYLEGFASDSADGKIIYVGNHVTLQFLKDAIKYGLGGIIGGSADRETFRYAVEAGISFGLFGGFGRIDTPEDVYGVLNNVSNRYVFFQGERNLLRIPMPQEEKVLSIEPNIPFALAEVRAGMRVTVLQRPYFGKSAVVDRVGTSSIFVKFGVNESSVEIFSPNFFILQAL
jgi:hypothetical protein